MAKQDNYPLDRQGGIPWGGGGGGGVAALHHIYYQYGIGPQKTILILVLGTYFHNSSVYGPSEKCSKVWIISISPKSQALTRYSTPRNPSQGTCQGNPILSI